jgi:hypothetical protein
LLAAVVGIGILAAVIIFVLGLSEDTVREQPAIEQPQSAVTPPTDAAADSANGGEQTEAPVLTTTAFERDEIRQEDVDIFLETALLYAQENRGRFPEASDEGWEVLTGLFAENAESLLDPRTNEPYERTAAVPAVGQIQYVERVVCDGDELATGQLRNVAFKTRLESGDFYCVSAE